MIDRLNVTEIVILTSARPKDLNSYRIKIFNIYIFKVILIQLYQCLVAMTEKIVIELYLLELFQQIQIEHYKTFLLPTLKFFVSFIKFNCLVLYTEKILVLHEIHAYQAIFICFFNYTGRHKEHDYEMCNQHSYQVKAYF